MLWLESVDIVRFPEGVTGLRQGHSVEPVTSTAEPPVPSGDRRSTIA